MAKSFYSLEEALKKLGCDEETLKKAVRGGDLREFRDGGKATYKVEDIDKLVAAGPIGSGHTAPSKPPPSPAKPSKKPSTGDDADLADLSDSLGEIKLGDTENPLPDLSASGSIGLTDLGGLSLADTAFGGSTASGKKADLPAEASDSSSINLATMGDEDMVSFEDEEGPDQTAAGKNKDDTVVSSVGVSVFDEDELDESADPLAKTSMGGTSGGTGLEGVGSGSGLLDLTRESDDTSLGAELLDEIYPGDETGTGTIEMGEATRAGLEEALPAADDEDTGEQEALPATADLEEAEAESSQKPAGALATVSYAADVFVTGAPGLVAIAIAVMCFAGLAIASMIRGTWPSLLDFVYGKLWMFGLGAVVVAGAAMGIGVYLGKRSSASK